LQCSEADCIADFVLQKDIRLKNPVACSLEFQSVMQIIVECMLHWDIKKKTSKGKGLLGSVLAFFTADEEQGRKLSIATGKHGSKKLMKHCGTVCSMKMILQGT
jgi:hypothetical protein